jgi:hypothetical protein
MMVNECVNASGAALKVGYARPGKDIKKWCVGITVDIERGHFYWTQNLTGIVYARIPE